MCRLYVPEVCRSAAIVDVVRAKAVDGVSYVQRLVKNMKRFVYRSIGALGPSATGVFLDHVQNPPCSSFFFLVLSDIYMFTFIYRCFCFSAIVTGCRFSV